MQRYRWCFSFALSLMVLVSTFAQQNPEVQVDLGRGATMDDLLRQHGVGLTEPDVVLALKSSDPTVRWAAAMKLADNKAVHVIPAVKQALAAEKDPRSRVNIAVALGLLGDPGGKDELKRLCADRGFPPEFRLYAVGYMFDLGVKKDEGCLHAAEKVVQTVNTDYHAVGYRNTALDLLPQFKDLTPEESQKVFHLVVGRLNDPEPTVRMAASQSLAVLGNAAAIPYMQTAIAKEQDEGVRSVLEGELKKLQGSGKE